MRPIAEVVLRAVFCVIPTFVAWCPPAAWGQGNSTAAHWVVENVLAGRRGVLIREAAKGTVIIPTLTPTATGTATPTASPTPTATATSTSAPSCVGVPDGTTCDAGLDFGNTLICVAGTCQACVPDGNGVATRFVDNGDGTITDLHTCLVWEKKDDAGGIHDKDNVYAWSTCGNDVCPPDGSAFTEFLAALNGSGFAGHRDWRLPSSAGLPACPTADPPEAESLYVASVPGCGDTGVLCVDPLFDTNCGTYLTGNPGCTFDGAGGTEQCSCTALGGAFGYYSSSVDACALENGQLRFAWGTNPTLEVPLAIQKFFGAYVRAVRGGVVFVL